jgi:shikimate dehydrogenase
MSMENDGQSNGQVRMRAAVLGSPIAHSLSPVIHNAAYLALGIEGKYDAVEVGSGELSNFMNEVKQTPANWIGFSLTMPLKEEILNIADMVDPLARRINSGNTLIPTKEGWYATSTDVSGFIWALAFNEIKEFEKVQIIGAGATARAVAAAIDAPGRTICVINRNSQRNSAMQSVVLDSNLEFCNWEEAELDADLVVNTTPKNAADSLSSGSGILFDVIYDPWPTTLAAKWNGRVIDGLELLVHQAIDQISLMTGFVIDRQLMAPLLRAAAEAELNDRQ